MCFNHLNIKSSYWLNNVKDGINNQQGIFTYERIVIGLAWLYVYDFTLNLLLDMCLLLEVASALAILLLFIYTQFKLPTFVVGLF